MSREFYQLLRSYGGLSLEYLDLIEADFAATAGSAYVPPERGDFRRNNVDRTIQLLSEAPGVIETFQTSDAVVSLPANDAANDLTNDAGDGRIFLFKNSGTGNLTIKDYNGTTLFIAAPLIMVIALSNTANSWSFFFTARNILFDNSTNSFTAGNVQEAIEESKEYAMGFLSHVNDPAGVLLPNAPFQVFDENGDAVTGGY